MTDAAQEEDLKLMHERLLQQQSTDRKPSFSTYPAARGDGAVSGMGAALPSSFPAESSAAAPQSQQSPHKPKHSDVMANSW